MNRSSPKSEIFAKLLKTSLFIYSDILINIYGGNEEMGKKI